MYIGHRKELKGWRFERWPFVNRSDEGLTRETSAFQLLTVANLCFNSVVNTKLRL